MIQYPDKVGAKRVDFFNNLFVFSNLTKKINDWYNQKTH